jgi:two-component system CheB/CheR fusion protein
LELAQLNSDLNNVLANIQICIVIVGADLRIRRFTPPAQQLLNLIATDVGRPITDLKPNLDLPDLKTWLREAVDNIKLQEREVRDHQGRRYSLRIRPYQTIDNKIDGAVVMLFDLEMLKRG